MRLFAFWLCALLLRRRFAPLFYSLLLLLFAPLLCSLVLLLLLGLLPSGVIGSLLLHPLILPFLILLDSLTFLFLPLSHPLLLLLVLLRPTGIPSVHGRWTFTVRPIVGMNRTRGPIVVAVGVRPTPLLVPLLVARTLFYAIGLLIVLRTLTWAVGLLIVPWTLRFSPIAALVTGSSVDWRIVGASCFSGWHAVFEVSGLCGGCDRRPAVVYGRSLLTIHSR